MKQERAVAFRSSSRHIAGTLVVPQGARAVALLIHGFGSFRDELMGFVELADRLAAHGIASLRIDMSGCGESGVAGYMLPRTDWIADVRAALSFLESTGTFDAERIALVGMSVGGGTVASVAALDNRPACVVSLAPVADGGAWLEHLWTSRRGGPDWQAFLERVGGDQQRYALTGVSELVSRADLLAHDSADLVERYPQFARLIALCSADDLMTFRPRLLAGGVRCPLRIIHSLDDESVPVDHARSLHAAAGGEKDLVLVQGSPHCFWIGPRKEEVLDSTVEWLRIHQRP